MCSNCALVTARTQAPAGWPGRGGTASAGAVGPLGSAHKPLTNITGVFGPISPLLAEGVADFVVAAPVAGARLAGFLAGAAGVVAGAVCATSAADMKKART